MNSPSIGLGTRIRLIRRTNRLSTSLKTTDTAKPSNQVFENGLDFRQMDARIAMLETGYQWIDLDPFGSPVQFLDAALQGLSRTGVLEITATDTAALTGSSASSQARRYGAKGNR
jgi:tRNA (guanine26-N2/guanine27-N2)-dimethyltransferase